jgi:proline iminopeptidase
MKPLREFYPPIEPYVSGRFAVNDIHSVYWEECGNPDGVPVVFLHGGPGGGCSATSRRFFDPARYRIVLFDQRGAGRSTPNGELRNNTTADLIADMALAYAQEFATVTLSLTLRGIFLMREAEIRWLFDAGRLFRPEAWDMLLAGLPVELRGGDPLEGYAALLDHTDPAVRLAAARRWCTFEANLANLLPDAARLAGATEEHVAHAMARIEVHYFRNNRYVPDDALLRGVARIRHLPATIVQGRYDLLCPPLSAFQLHQAWPGSRLVVVEDAGHSATEPTIRSALITVMDERVAAR